MKIYSVIGLGFGDEGKGSIVDYIGSKHRDKKILVIRPNGGCQSAHHVVTPDGIVNRFSQVGAAYFISNCDTYLGPNFICSFNSLLDEIFKLNWRPVVNINKDTLTTTELFKLVNLYKLKKSGLNNSCGFGIGETRSYWLKYGSDALTAKDWKEFDTFSRKYELHRQRLCNQYYNNEELVQILLNDNTDFKIFNKLQKYNSINIVDRIDNIYDIIIFEHSQGVLLDEHIGIGAPEYVTWSDCTDRHMKQILYELNTPIEDVCKIGVLRTYSTRHGDGVFFTSKKFKKFVELHNNSDGSQGKFRYGEHQQYLIDRALKYVTIDKIAWTCADQFPVPNIKNHIPNKIISYGPTYHDKYEI